MEKYNDKICLTYAELTDGDPDAIRPEDRPIIGFDNLKQNISRKRIVLARRACYGTPALVEYDSLPVRFKEAVVAKYGDPYKHFSQYCIRDMYVRDLKAFDFFSLYRFDGNRRLSDEKIAEYTANASVLNLIATIASDRELRRKSLNRPTRDVWGTISAELNPLQSILGCNLPENARRLKHKSEEYQKNGYASLISNKFGNRNRAKVVIEEQKALLTELLGDGRNIENETVKMLYNSVAVRMGWEEITAATVANYRKQLENVTYAGRHGATEYRNNKAVQVKRKAPSCPLYFVTVDGWDAELLYQKVEQRKDKDGKIKNVTTYHNRPTVVVLLDPCQKYIIGYAIGTHETPELIRAAFRNAFQHIRQLFGAYYKPWQLQTDNYGRGNLKPFYEACTDLYTPARAHNAKAKVIEPFFGQFNRKYFRLQANTSGVGVTSKKSLQPNSERMNQVKKYFPDWNGVCAQIDAAIQADRKEKIDAYMTAWNAMPETERSPFTYEEYLRLFGETTGFKNSLTGQGVGVTIAGSLIWYDNLTPLFRQHGNNTFIIRYDPADLSHVLATVNVGKGKELQEGDIAFILKKKHEQPMALRDRQPGDYEEWQRIQEYNAIDEKRIIETRRQARETVDEMFETNPALNDTLAKFTLCDSRGQHKNERNVLSGRAPEELPTSCPVLEEEYEEIFDPTTDVLNQF